MAVTVLTTQQIAQVQATHISGDIQGTWQLLATFGDTYADNAAEVLDQNGVDPLAPIDYSAVAISSWETAGADLLKFGEIANDYQQRYIDHLAREGGALPTTANIEQYYREALVKFEQPPLAAIDASLPETAWATILGMESERITQSTVNDSISATDKTMHFLQTMLRAFQLQQAKLDGNAVGIELNFDAFLGTFARRNVFDPLVLDLDGDGIETTAEAGASGVRFDFEGDGIKTPTGWVSADDGLLVLDRNNNGSIDNGSELFSDYTPLADGTVATNGVDALRSIDSSGDGLISADDAQFANLRVWRDLDQDGVSDSNELSALNQLGITAIDTNARVPTQTNLGNGNIIEETISYYKADGTTGTVGEVWFQGSGFDAQFTTPIALTAQAAMLPQVEATGMVRDLREAMSLDSSGQLTALVEQFTNASTRIEQKALFDQLLAQWADTSPMRTYSGGIYFTSQANGSGLTTFVNGVATDRIAVQVRYGFAGVTDPNSVEQRAWETKLGVLERFNGRYFFNLQTRTPFGEIREQIVDGYATTLTTTGSPDTVIYVQNLNQENMDALQRSYESLYDYAYQALTIQTRLQPYYAAIGVEAIDGYLALTFSAVENHLALELSAHADKAIIDFAEFVLFSGVEFSSLGWNGADLLSKTLTARTDGATLRATLVNAGITPPDGGNDTFTGNERANLFLAGTGDDVVRAEGGDDVIVGEAGNDVIYGGFGDDLLSGGEGNDTLDGGYGGDVLDGGVGADSLAGNLGGDTYIWGLGYGRDTIFEYESANSNSIDTVVVSGGLRPSDMALRQYNGDLFITVIGSTDELVIKGQFNTSEVPRIDRIRFEDGTQWNAAEISRLVLIGTDGSDSLTGFSTNDVLEGRGGNDLLLGNGGNDTLMGGIGNDILFGKSGDDRLDGAEGTDSLLGGMGNDFYLFGRGYGHDTITEEWDVNSKKIDTVAFSPGVSPSDLKMTREGNDLSISIKGTTDRLKIIKQLENEGDTYYRIERFRFADGTEWDYRDVKRLLLIGNGDDDVIVAYSSDDTLDGQEGNDSLNGGAGNDTIFGGDGVDKLDGGDGMDVLLGGRGNDSLNGGKGDDTYRLGRGDEMDSILESADLTQHGFDVVEFRADIAPSDIILRRVETDLVINIRGTDDQVRVSFQLPYGEDVTRVEQFKFSDGTTWNHEIVRLAILTGDGSANLIRGYNSSDTIAGNAGDDYLDGDAGDDTVSGGDGNDTLYGNSGNDVLDGGTGNDLLDGEAGSDSYLFGRGHGLDTISQRISTDGPEKMDTLTFGVGVVAGDVAMRRVENDLVISIKGTTDELVILKQFTDEPGSYHYRVDRFEFNDGTTLNYDQLFLSETIRGTDGHDWIGGTLRDDVLLGLAGNDILVGLSGYDEIYGGEGSDVLEGGAMIDFLFGEAGNDVLNGGAGLEDRDSLDGGFGDDTYLFTIGSDDDRISDAGGMDTVRFDVGILPHDVQVQRSGDDLWITNRGSATLDSIYVANWYIATDKPIERAEFSDGTVWNVDYFLTNPETILGTLASDVLSGTSLNDIIRGLDGNDTLSGLLGDDVLDGGKGSDTLKGGYGNDTFLVDSSSDVIAESSGQGTDTVQSIVTWTLGSNLENLALLGSAAINGTGNSLANTLIGNDANNTLSGSTGADRLEGRGGNDTLNGGGGADTMIGGVGNDTYVVENAGDSVVEIDNEGIDLVQSTITATLSAHVENLTLTGTAVVNATGNSLGNVLKGNSANNTLAGLAGDDTLDGGTGSDTMLGGSGHDTYVVNVATDVVTENINEGTDTIKSSVTLSLGAHVENLILTGTSALNGTGNELNNVLTGNSAANILTGNAGDDTLDGGSGTDTMRGGIGNDVYVVNVATDVVTENLNEGTDTVRSAVTLTLGANVENLTLTGTSAINGTGNTLANTLLGNSAVNTLSASSGDDTLQGEGGNDSLDGGAGNDRYVFGRADGQDRLLQNDSSSTADVLALEAGIAADQLWFTHTGNDLKVSVIGTTDQVTLVNWYSGSAHHVDRIETAAGAVLLDAQVELLISAMAGMIPPAAGQLDLSPEQQAQLAPTLAASWQGDVAA